jgi:hypothetical protein
MKFLQVSCYEDFHFLTHDTGFAIAVHTTKPWTEAYDILRSDYQAAISSERYRTSRMSGAGPSNFQGYEIVQNALSERRFHEIAHLLDALELEVRPIHPV